MEMMQLKMKSEHVLTTDLWEDRDVQIWHHNATLTTTSSRWRTGLIFQSSLGLLGPFDPLIPPPQQCQTHYHQYFTEELDSSTYTI